MIHRNRDVSVARRLNPDPLGTRPPRQIGVTVVGVYTIDDGKCLAGMEFEDFGRENPPVGFFAPRIESGFSL